MNVLARLGCGAAAALALATAALAAPDEDLLGKADGYPVGSYMDYFKGAERTRVGMFSHMDKVLPASTLARADTPSPLPRAATVPALRYDHLGQPWSVDDFLARQRVTGLLVVKDGEVLVERFQYDRTAADRFLSNSMSKSITSLAVGLALQDGKIASLDDRASRYVTELAGHGYGDATIRQLLRMSSGVRFEENYSGQDDLARFGMIWWTGGGLVKALQAFDEHDAKPGERFHYASTETAVLGLVVMRATGTSLSRYVEQRLWKPMGAEADAKWNVDLEREEMAAGNFNAVLRDYGRLGVLLANDGQRDGKQILPRDYLLEATDWHRQPDSLAPGRATPLFGYGYQFWILPGERRSFALIGIYGQAIYVDPELKLVMVQTAVAATPSVGKESLGAESYGLWLGLQAQFRKRASP